MVQTAKPRPLHLLVAAATGVSIAVVAKDEASGAAGHNGETTDGPLGDRTKGRGQSDTYCTATDQTHTHNDNVSPQLMLACYTHVRMTDTSGLQTNVTVVDYRHRHS